jgi:hypothetical protein
MSPAIQLQLNRKLFGSDAEVKNECG